MFVSYILAKVQAYFRYRETVRELSLLSDRELTDLGIARVQIDSIARQGAAAYHQLPCSNCRRPPRQRALRFMRPAASRFIDQLANCRGGAA